MGPVDVWCELEEPDALVKFMHHRRESVRGLAAKCIVPDRRTGQPKALSHAMIGHLRTGRVKTTSPQTAAAIEAALDLPIGFLFKPRYQRRTQPNQAA